MNEPKPAAVISGIDYTSEDGATVLIELNEEQWAQIVKNMTEDREPTPMMRRTAYRHRAMVKAKNEGRLSIDTLQDIFAEADREFEANSNG